MEMKSNSVRLWAVAGLCSLFLLPGLCEARGAERGAARAVLLPAGDDGNRAAFTFDVSGLSPGQGEKIRVAVIEWRLDGIPADRISEYRVYEITESWTAAGAALEAPSMAESEASEWLISPRDYRKTRGGVVRLDVTDLVDAWTAGASNHGIAVAAPEVDRQNVAASLDRVRLVIRYEPVLN
jgi:hypothetical protein